MASRFRQARSRPSHARVDPLMRSGPLVPTCSAAWG